MSSNDIRSSAQRIQICEHMPSGESILIPLQTEILNTDYFLMPIPVLKLPFLIQQSIWKEMNYSQLTVFSFCSLRIRRLIEFLNLTAPKFRYSIQEGSLHFSIPYDSGNKTVLFLREKQRLRKKKSQKINLSDVKVRARISRRFDNQGDIYYMLYVRRIGRTIQRALQQHVNSLFHYSGPNELKIKIDWKFSSPFCLSKLKRLPSLKKVTDGFIRGEKIDAKTLEDYFTKYPNHHSVRIEAKINGVISEDSKIWNIERLCIQKQASEMFLRRFTGQHLVLVDTKWKFPDLLHLLEEWVSNRAFQNLTTLLITEAWKGMNGIDYDEMIGRFRLQQYKPTIASRQPTHIHYNTHIIDVWVMDIELKYFYEMKRSDGKRAVLRCDPQVVFFFVDDNME